MILQEKEQRKKIQLLFLIAAGMLPFFAILAEIFFPGVGYFLSLEYAVFPCLLFVGSMLTTRLNTSAKWSLCLSAVAVFWFVVVQVRHYQTYMITRNIDFAASGYLLAFLFAAVTEDGVQNMGLKWIGRIYLGFSSLMVLLTVLLYMEILPEIMAPYVFWDGARVRIFWHPNGSAFVLLLGLGFSLYFLSCAEQKWKKWTLAVLLSLHFLTLVLTNSRTTILLACALMAGTVFFAIWKTGWRQFLTGAAAAIVMIVLLLFVYSGVYDLHKDVQIQKVLTQTQEEKTENVQVVVVDEQTGELSISGAVTSSQGELSKDMKTLNGRTGIWKAAFRAMLDNKNVAIWGMEYIAAEVSYRNAFPVSDCHNAWIQMMLLAGIPGLLIAVAYTLIAIRNLCLVMFRTNQDVSRKVVAMMVICLLAGSILEAYLFTGEDLSNCENFLFFLLTGYLVQWNRKTDSE